MSGDSRAMNSALETVNAAATAIAMAENRVPQASVRKRRWGGNWLSMYWCFGTPNRNGKRNGHIVPETALAGPTVPRSEDPSHPPPVLLPPQILLPFIAPPSSPASFLQSEPPSAAQSPVGLLSVSASMYSPGGPRSIFAIGPYAHETQLVSPPVFYTEPSTATVTPPPESAHLTATTTTATTPTPPSPEVPFAQLLDPKFQRVPIFHNEFQSYHLQPGSPVGQLISPSSISGTSSPFPDRDFCGGPHFIEFRALTDTPKLLSLERLSDFDWGSRLASRCPTPDNSGRAAKKPEDDGAVSTSLAKTSQKEAPAEPSVPEDHVARQHQKHRSITLGSSKDFNFDNVETVDPIKPGVGSDWWANEKVVGNEISGSENWPFFPLAQPSVS